MRRSSRPRTRVRRRYGIFLLLLLRIASSSPALAACAEDAHVPDAVAPADQLFERSRLTGDWDGWRGRWEDAGVRLGATYLGEILGNFSGGNRQRTIYESRVDFSLDLDLEKALCWGGVTFHANAYRIDGRGLSTVAVGNLLPISSIEARPTTRLFDLWLEQQFLEQTMSVRAGKIAADDEFFISQYAMSFINGTFGWPGIMAVDLPSGGPAYPLSTPGLRIRGAPPNAALSWSAAVFNGDPAGTGPGDPQARNASGTDFSIGNSALFIAEAAYAVDTAPDVPLPLSEIKLGAWYHTGHFTDLRFDSAHRSLADPQSTGTGAVHGGDFGFYLVADEMLWREPGTSDQGLAGFLRLAGTPAADRNLISFYVDGGSTYRGPFPGRDHDVAGLGLSFARISGAARGLDRDTIAFKGTALPVHDYEAVIEATYQARIAPWWLVQPDLQIVLHPGGHVPEAAPSAAGRAIPDAMVLGLRTTVIF